MNLLCRPLQNGSRSGVARQVVLAVTAHQPPALGIASPDQCFNFFSPSFEVDLSSYNSSRFCDIDVVVARFPITHSLRIQLLHLNLAHILRCLLASPSLASQACYTPGRHSDSTADLPFSSPVFWPTVNFRPSRNTSIPCSECTT